MVKIKEIIKIIIALIPLGIIACEFVVSLGISYISDKFKPKEPKEYNPREWKSDDQPYGEEIMLNVLKCFDEHDKEALKNMFSKKAQSAYNFQKQINQAIDLYDGKSVSHDKIYCNAQGSHFNIDHYEYKSVLIETKNIVTDTGKTYPKIELTYVLVSDKNPSEIWIVAIYFSDKHGDVIFRIFDDSNIGFT